MKNSRQLLVCLPIFAIPFLMANFSFEPKEKPNRLLSPLPSHLSLMDTMLPTGYNELFAGSGVCQKCHGFDTLGIASVDAFGNDVNLVSDWRATMMANSAKDPFWKAKVSHEVMLYPQHKNEIENKCTSCHAPSGHFNAKHLGLPHFTMADLAADPLARDGVSCLGCHQQLQEGIGLQFSGHLEYDTFKMAYGPYANPLVSPMLTETGYKPEHSSLMDEAVQCAGCHTLMTETLDFDGNPTGNHFVEQATYHEWVNSAYEDSISCQGCHMPSLDKFPVYLVTGAETEPRNPFYLHEFVGGNVTMLKLLKGNIEALGVTASAAQFDEVIAKTVDMLQNRTLDLELELLDRDADTARFAVTLVNKAGHKFPSGYPSRRAFIEFSVKNQDGETIFISGKTDEEFEVYGQNPDYEPHYQTITSEDQVQIYELVMGDVNGDVTTVLLRANQPIKDNRLPPLGFTSSHYAYDTTLIAGSALIDGNFNKTNSTEGSGSDVVFYHIPVSGELGQLEVSAKVWYQSLPPKWNKEMFDHHTAEIDAFRTMFDAADRMPVLIKEVSLEAPSISAGKERKRVQYFVKLHPVPSSDGRIFVQSYCRHDVQVYDLKGRLVESWEKKSGNYELALKGKGVFLLKFMAGKRVVQTEKVVVQ